MILLLALCLSALAGDLKVVMLDVGQGDSILLEASNGKRILVDAGPKKANVASQLKRRGIKKLDLVIASHAHADHIGGMAAVLEAYKPKIFVDNGMRHSTMTYRRTMLAVEDNGSMYLTGVQDRVFNVDDDLKLTILHPRSTRLQGTRSDHNSNSIVIRVDHGDNCILLTGDSEDPTERSMLQHQVKPCEVLKVAHHGSAHSTSSSWLRTLKPKHALISAGASNRYGHPDPDTLDRLKSAGVEVHRTDLQGAVTVLSTGRGDKHSIRISSERKIPQDGLAALNDESSTLYGPPQLTATGAIDINRADILTLDRLPGIGPARAASIIADREQNGPFSSCDALQRVHGIGHKTVSKLSAQCTATQAEDTP
jgi:competence protein ComEC